MTSIALFAPNAARLTNCDLCIFIKIALYQWLRCNTWTYSAHTEHTHEKSADNNLECYAFCIINCVTQNYVLTVAVAAANRPLSCSFKKNCPVLTGLWMNWKLVILIHVQHWWMVLAGRFISLATATVSQLPGLCLYRHGISTSTWGKESANEIYIYQPIHISNECF